MNRIKSIKTRMMGSYLLVTVLTVAFLISFLLMYIRSSYMDSIKSILMERAESCSNFYNDYLTGDSIVNSTEKILDNFPKMDAQLQIYDSSGRILSDTLNIIPLSEERLSPDVVRALSGNYEFYRYHGQYEELISLSYPLKKGTKTDGVIRQVISLNDFNQTIRRISLNFIMIGIGIVLIVAIISYMLSITITKPIQILTDAAGEMAGGRYNSRVPIKSKDEIGKLADTLNLMADEIEKREKLKNEFIASVSHDIRTPLTSIRGWIETLNTDDVQSNEELHEGLSIVESESIRLSAMVEDLLDFSKFSIGEISLEITDIDLNNFLTVATKQIRQRVNRQNILLKNKFPGNSCMIKADEKRLKQVLFNLLDNSLKNTPPEGMITLGYQTEETTIELYIEDTGCGIPEDEIPEITKKFYVGKGKKTGSGLGLSIVTDIVKLHQWELRIHSTLGAGTRVSIIIPL